MKKKNEKKNSRILFSYKNALVLHFKSWAGAANRQYNLEIWDAPKNEGRLILPPDKRLIVQMNGSKIEVLWDNKS